MISYVAIFSLCVLAIQAQVPRPGSCPEIASVQQNLDLTKYLGKWYEEEKYDTLFELNGKCITAEYSLNENGTVKVLNTEVHKDTGEVTSIEGSAKPAGTTNEGKFVVTFSVSGIQVDAPYWVLETDYDSYSVVWSCVSIPPIVNYEYAWILTREQVPSQQVLDKAYAVFDRLKLSKKELIKTDQKNC